jgi:predicted GNAT superfamily acetyltransferase
MRKQNPPKPAIRPLRTLEEYRQCEHVQKEVWGNHAVAAEVLSVTQKYGGAVLGAVVGKKVVGFLYAFLARRHGKLLHWSHMMAVLPPFRDRGLGFRMKLVHRQLALSQGIKTIGWTYDPLQSRNAALNLLRLGAEVEEYIPDYYGQFPSRIERGLPSDRFVVIWRLDSKPVEKRLAVNDHALVWKPAALINETTVDSRGYLANRKLRLRLDKPRLFLEIPYDTDAMRGHAPTLSLKWRMETRRAFQHYLGAGYRVRGFYPRPAEGGIRCYYLLSRGTNL